MLKKRVITALWLIILVVAALWFDRPLPWFTILIAAWGVLAVLEVYRLMGVSRIPVLLAIGIIWTAAFAITPYFSSTFYLSFLLTSIVIVSMIVLLAQPRRDGLYTAWAWMLAGSLYAGWLMSFLVRLRLDGGKEWAAMALFATFASDTLAFLVGRAIGKHKLAPRISPAKTWEGAFAGIIGAVVATVIIVALLPPPIINYGWAVLFGVIISILGQIGGMAASLLKRTAGVKDSGSILPGHGGVLDRMDSVVFAGVTAYIFFVVASGKLFILFH